MHPDHAGPGPHPESLRAASAVVVVVSDRCAAGLADDRSGPVAVDLLRRAGMTVGEPVVVPDGAEQVRDALTAVLDAGPRL
ncbi:MAG: MogA/MoaB family molybdenum cofactor biosynthesis protein, partial [Actinomycetales bacterium]|nr:MogA/MoaB family molybdenum cofactor biosynthesis protein [Actinomycetales bacterium]